jgi:hypothetical protein
VDDSIDATNVTGGDETDNALLAELRILAAQGDPIPPEAIASARSAIAWRTMDAELAELTSDPTPHHQLADVRSLRSPILLTFEATSLTVEVEILETATGRRMIGQLAPPVAGEIEVRHGAGTTTVAADQVGRFRVEDVAAGPVSLRCSAGSQVVQTDWFLT